MTQGQPNIIPPVEQAFLAESVNFKSQSRAIRAYDFLLIKINRQSEAGRRFDLSE